MPGLRTADRDWLDLVTDLLQQPLTGWPEEQVVGQLIRTFDLATCSFVDVGLGSAGVHRIRPLDDSLGGHRSDIEQWAVQRSAREHPLLCFYGATGQRVPVQTADVPDRFVGRAARAGWEEVSALFDSRFQLALPLRLSAAGRRALVLGRPTPFSPAELLLATRIWRLLTGLDRQVAALRATAIDGALAPAADVLTPRETAVLQLLSAGLTSSAIGRRLGISERTVQKHLSHVYAKLGVGDRLTAVLRGQQLGLLLPPATSDGSASLRPRGC
jgi:DNA-binding NarL/FixJ family response regulator